jgi:hypothetical protein
MNLLAENAIDFDSESSEIRGALPKPTRTKPVGFLSAAE